MVRLESVFRLQRILLCLINNTPLSYTAVSETIVTSHLSTGHDILSGCWFSIPIRQWVFIYLGLL